MGQKTNRNSFVTGAAILAAAGLLVRLIGAGYRLPLAYMIGDEGVGIYTQAYPFYNFLLIFSTSGIPSAIAKMVSEALVLGEYKTVRKILRVSMVTLFFIGLASALLLFFSSGAIAGIIKDTMVKESLMALSPALFFVALISVFRGYFQGHQNMKPTAFSQLVEQVVKLVLGLYLAKTFSQYGVQYGAAGALVGVSVSELLALLMLLVTYALNKPERPRGARASRHVLSTREILSQLMRLAIPIMLAASVMALAMMIDSLTLQSRLQQGGISEAQGRSMIGLLGMANNIVNVTSVLSMALSMSLVPSLAQSQRMGEKREVRQKSAMGVKLSIALVMPASAGLMALAQPILALLYGRTIAPENMQMSAMLLTIAAAGAMFLSLVQTTNGILQGLGRVNVPLISLGAGAAVKIACNYFLVSNPAVGIYGACIGTVACYIVASVLNVRAVQRAARMRLHLMDMILRPLGATLLMAGAAYLTHSLLARVIGSNWAVIVAILLAVCVYAVALVALGGIGDAELGYIPGGRKLRKLLMKTGLLRVDGRR